MNYHSQNTRIESRKNDRKLLLKHLFPFKFILVILSYFVLFAQYKYKIIVIDIS